MSSLFIEMRERDLLDRAIQEDQDLEKIREDICRLFIPWINRKIYVNLGYLSLENKEDLLQDCIGCILESLLDYDRASEIPFSSIARERVNKKIKALIDPEISKEWKPPTRKLGEYVD